ncbi:MAG: hypothetical protein H7Y12_09450 [Sphingobacteriaceae bacterium]|nr:hypothetical protein [Cytophagaceae bacterium]
MKTPSWLISPVLLLCLAGRTFAFTPHLSDSLRPTPGPLIPGWKQSIAVAVGTNGIGAEWVIHKNANLRWQYRAAVHYFGYAKPSTINLNAESPLLLIPTVQMSMVRAQADWHPFRRGTFHLSGGLALGIAPRYAARLVAEQGIRYYSINLSEEEFGTLEFELRYRRVMPYLGLGLGRAVPHRRFGVSADLGCFYIGSPRLSLFTDGLIESTTLPDELPNIERNMKNYSFLPSLNLYFRYRLTP